MSLFQLEVSQGNRNYFRYFKQEGIYFGEIVFFFFFSNHWKSWRVEAQSKSSFVLRPVTSFQWVRSFRNCHDYSCKRHGGVGNYLETTAKPLVFLLLVKKQQYIASTSRLLSKSHLNDSLAGSNLNSTGEFPTDNQTQPFIKGRT